MEISAEKGNPAFGFRQTYQELMGINDPNTLYLRVLGLIKSYEGHGISPLNAYRFKTNIERIKDDITQMKFLVSNFILKADGMGVFKSR